AIRTALRAAGCVEFGERDGGLVESPDTADDPFLSAVPAIRISTVMPRSTEGVQSNRSSTKTTHSHRPAQRAGEHEVHGGTSEGNRRDGSGRGSGRDHTRAAA